MITEFCDYLLKVKNLQPATVDEYRKDLTGFAEYAGGKGLRWSTITTTDIEAWLMSLHDLGLLPATIRRRLASLRAIYKYMYTRRLIEDNPAAQAEAPKNPKRLPEAINKDLFLRYLITYPTTEKARLIHAFVALTLETGIRISEALNLQTSDFNKQTRTILINGKGRKQRVVYYGELTATYLNLYNPLARGEVFHTHEQRLIRQWLLEELRAWHPHVHPHMIRHTFASTMVENGFDLYTISKLLGHESVATTERYIAMPNERLRTSAEMYRQNLYN